MTQEEINNILLDPEKEAEFRKKWFEEFMSNNNGEHFYDQQKQMQVYLFDPISIPH